MTRPVALTALSAGISRLRIKGGADPATLYDLLNGYVTLNGTVVSRPGTTQHAELPVGSKGLATFEGEHVVFAATLLEDMPDGYRCEVLIHPTNDEAELSWIWFAAPYLGFLYVSAEWSDGQVFHYWLQGGEAWEADHAYTEGELVEPTVRNGYVYRATRLGNPGVVWAANVARTIGDVVEPTVPNGFDYECVDVLGANPRSGATEPTWPTEDGATVAEDTDLVAPVTPATGTPATAVLPETVVDRYGSGLNEGYSGIIGIAQLP